MNIIFVIITVLWLAEFLIFPSLKKENQSRQKSFLLILFSILTIIIINAVMYFKDLLLVENTLLKIIALMIYLTGLILRYWSLILLGNNFSREVEVANDQELISHGTYKYIRHPLYLGLFLLVIAVPLFFGNLLVFLSSILIMFLAISFRIKEEESFMEAVLGSRYLSWKNKRFKFLPFIY